MIINLLLNKSQLQTLTLVKHVYKLTGGGILKVPTIAFLSTLDTPEKSLEMTSF